LVSACALVTGCSSSTDAPNEGCVDNGSSALTTCAAGTTVKGIDVSVYQGTVGWAQVKAGGWEYAYIRVSDGLNYPDSKFATNWPAAKTAGVIRGAYQFFRPGQDPTMQADAMVAKINAAGGLEAGDLPPVLDIEVTDGVASTTIQSRAKTWLQEVEKKTGVKPLVYTANFMSSAIGTALGSYTLWVANYGATCPLMPSGWTNWKFWQNADNGSIPGISGNTDTDLFNGNKTQLAALTIQPPKPPPSTPPPSEPQASNDPPPTAGSEGSTLGSGNPAPAPAPDPCSR
jgi:lysozyme